MHSIDTYPHSPLLGVPAKERTHLAIFKGRMEVKLLARLLQLVATYSVMMVGMPGLPTLLV